GILQGSDRGIGGPGQDAVVLDFDIAGADRLHKHGVRTAHRSIVGDGDAAVTVLLDVDGGVNRPRERPRIVINGDVAPGGCLSIHSVGTAHGPVRGNVDVAAVKGV